MSWWKTEIGFYSLFLDCPPIKDNLSTMDKEVGPNGVHYSEVPLYQKVKSIHLGWLAAFGSLPTFRWKLPPC